MKRLALAAAIFLTGCGRYADFFLPAPQTAGPAQFKWEANAAPVLERGSATDVLNPSVVRFHEVYWNLYSEYDGKSWHTAAATSPDGLAWTKQGRVIDAGTDYIAANGSALVVGEEIFYWYETGYPLQLALAKSRDGKQWTREGIVLKLGPYRSFDERAVADPYVIRSGDYFYLYYLGQDRGARQRLGVARSQDGMTWERLRTNPIMEGGAPESFDAELGEPAVWESGGWWWMLYTGRARNEQRRLGLARSRDGIWWERTREPIASGDQPWNREVMADPTVELRGNTVRVWFGGGDIASPDQNLHGQIGFGILR